ncbi:MAG: DUF6443 domain-containing protein, partial [Chitinophagales bacterium]
MAYGCKEFLKKVLVAQILCRILPLLFVVLNLLYGSYGFAQGGAIEVEPIFGMLTGTALQNNNEATASFPGGPQPKKIKNIITLSIKEESSNYISTDFTATIKVGIDYGHTSSYGNYKEVTLTVNYSRAQGAKYNTKSYFRFEDAEYVKIKIVPDISITPAVAGTLDLREVLLLKNEIRATEFFNLANDLNPLNLHTESSTEDEVLVRWNLWPANKGVTHTQLEWTWVETELESYYHDANGALSDELLFRNNATRIDLSASVYEYSIPKLYDAPLPEDGVPGGGNIYYRIRAVNIGENGTRANGPWSSRVDYYFDGHQPEFNWQVTTSFAEEGKRNTVIQYYDGSLRPRQTVTKDNISGKTITAETFYDGQGRPAIQILPVPGISTIIKYQADLNRFNNQLPQQDPADIFDLQPLNGGSGNLRPLDGDVDHPGADYYYSIKNPDKDGVNKYIPDAGGYPYTQTQYTPDGTGRIMKQSGLGPEHKFGSDHEIKYYYGSPSQEELDALFGTEVGNRTHYFKNMVKDANGQMSVSYVDMHGRTIATALAGEHPDNLEELKINNALMYPPGQPTERIDRNLLDNNTNIVKGNAIEAINTLLVSVPDEYDFTYSLDPGNLELPSCTTNVQLCYDCLYDLEISVTDESGDEEPLVWKFKNVTLNPDDNCATPSPGLELVSNPSGSIPEINGNSINFQAQLASGSYSVRKTLTISESSLQHYLELYGSNSMCESKDDIIEAVFEVLKEQSGCDNPPESQEAACTACTQNLGATEIEFRSNFLTSLGLNPTLTQSQQLEAEIHTSYITAYNNCQLLCNKTSNRSLSTIRQMMLEDMMPFSGQYARLSNPNPPPQDAEHWDAPLYYKYDIFSTQYAGQPFYKFPKSENNNSDFYRDGLGNEDGSLYDLTILSNNVLSSVTPDQFQQLFKDTWANSLLYYHPEFQKLKYAEDNLAASYNWIDDFTAVNSYSVASNGSHNYILTSGNTTAAPYNDPFYSLATPVSEYRNKMIEKIDTKFFTTGNGDATMWQVAYSAVMCKNYTNPSDRNDCMLAAPVQPPYNDLTDNEKDQVWQAYKALYANERRKDVNKYIAEHTPVVENNELIAQKY